MVKNLQQILKNFADTIDVLTKGEIGRGNFSGAFLVAAGIAAGIAFAPLALYTNYCWTTNSENYIR